MGKITMICKSCKRTIKSGEFYTDKEIEAVSSLKNIKVTAVHNKGRCQLIKIQKWYGQGYKFQMENA